RSAMLNPGKRVADIFSRMKASSRAVSMRSSIPGIDGVIQSGTPRRISARKLRHFRIEILREYAQDDNDVCADGSGRLLRQLHRKALHRRLGAALDRVGFALTP